MRVRKNTPRKPRDTAKPHVGFARAVLPPPEKNDYSGHINLDNLEESIQQMIQKTLKSMDIQKHENIMTDDLVAIEVAK